MKRIIWAIAAAAVLVSGCQRQSCSEVEQHLVRAVRNRECHLLMEVTYVAQSVFPDSVEMAEISVEQLGLYSEGIKMSPFLNKELQGLNDGKLDLVNDTRNLYKLFLNTPTNEWYTSEEIKTAKIEIIKKKAKFVKDVLNMCT